MVELKSRAQKDNLISPEAERFLQKDRARTLQMAQHAIAEESADTVTMTNDTEQALGSENRDSQREFNLNKLMHSLQERFSHTGDISSEIKEIVEAQVEMRTRDLFRQANYDALTHLPNRSYFHTTLEQLVISANKDKAEFALLFLDLDGFKAVNDTMGHQAGDELLRNVSARLVAAVREGDIVSRLGGDEFVVLLAGVIDKDTIETINHRIIREVSRPFWIQSKEVKISTSIGVACYPQDAKSSTELVEHADQALYISKKSGRATSRFYADISQEVSLSNYELVDLLEAAVERGEIEAVFEPQIDLSSQELVGASITAKWNEPEIESPYLVSWLDLLNVSQSGYVVGCWLIDSALFYLKQWQQQKNDMVISIPVMDKVWQENDLVAFMEQRLARFGLLSSEIQLEFTAKSLQEFEELGQVLNELTDAGYQITISDIGRHSLDMTTLAMINLSELKLDRDWLYESIKTERGHKWAQGLIQMAKKLDLCVIATGIMDAEQAQTYKKMGCTMGQGMNWSAPLDAKDFLNDYLAASK